MKLKEMNWACRVQLLTALILLLDTLILLAYRKINLGTILPGVLGVGWLLILLNPDRIAGWRQHTLLNWLWLAGRALLGLWLASLAVFIGLLLWQQNQTLTKPPAAIVVLGAGLRGTAPSPTLQNRLDAAHQLARQYPSAPMVVSGGQGLTEEIPEALAMQRYLLVQGIAANRIIMEDRSTSTAENLQFSRAILQPLGIDPATQAIAIVTSDFHTLRAQRIAHTQGYRQTSLIPAATPLSIRPNAWLREYFVSIKSWLLGES